MRRLVLLALCGWQSQTSTDAPYSSRMATKAITNGRESLGNDSLRRTPKLSHRMSSNKPMKQPTNTAAKEAGDQRLVVPLSLKQKEAFLTIKTEWARAALGIPSVSLLALERKGLIECRRLPQYPLCIMQPMPYHSCAYEWRLKHNDQIHTSPHEND